MSLSYDGEPLIVPTTEIIEWIANNIDPRHHTIPWVWKSWPGKRLTGTTFPQGYYPLRRIELNKFIWHLGASRWSYMHVCADRNEVDNLLGDAYAGGIPNLLPLVMNVQPNKETFTAQMYMLPPRPLSGIRGVNGLYLLTLVGPSYFWWYYDTPDFAIATPSMTPWESLYSQIGAVLDIDIDVDPINANYVFPNAALNLPHEALPVVLDAIAWNVGQRIVVNYDGTVKAQNYENGLAQQQTNLAVPGRNIKAGGAMLNSEET